LAAGSEPEVLEKAHVIFHAKDWLFYKLTGLITSDETDESLTMLKMSTRKYDPELFRIFGIEDLYTKFYENVPIPIHFLLDVGHQCSYEVTGEDRDTYLWLRELGKYSPLIQLQQMDGTWDRHWTFTRAHNAEGVIQMDKVVQALEQSGAEEVFLFPELIHPFEFPEDKLLEEMDESYAYLKQFVSESKAAA